MLIEAISAVYILANIAYHRWIEDKPPGPKPARSINIPRTDSGAAIPLIYGRCRVESPCLAWVGTPQARSAEEIDDPSVSGGAAFIYGLDMFFIVGIPFQNGDGINRVHNVWAGGKKLLHGGALPLLTGDGGEGSETIAAINNGGFEGDGGFVGGQLEFLNGNSDQQLCDPTTPFAATTAAGTRMGEATDPSLVPGFRGYSCVFLYGEINQWMIGGTPNPGSYAFEASSYPSDPLGDQPGDEANPADVIYDLLNATFAKLGISSSNIDTASFEAAAATLADEEHGYSRSIEDYNDAREVLNEILIQIDGVLYEDPTDDKIKIKLIREGDAVVGHITPDNCDSLSNVVAGGWSGIVNKTRIVFLSRALDYREDSETFHNQANTDGGVRELVFRMPGVCTKVLATKLAKRESRARSRPIAKFQATVDRSFYRVVPGDVVMVTWPQYHVDGRLFRVARANRGSLNDNHIVLDLIEDYF